MNSFAAAVQTWVQNPLVAACLAVVALALFPPTRDYAPWVAVAIMCLWWFKFMRGA